MNNTQLETFLKIVETRNFTLAANLLGYAQSTVTTQIKQLEEELGCLLFERLGKSLTVTAEGEKLSIYAEKMLQGSHYEYEPKVVYDYWKKTKKSGV